MIGDGAAPKLVYESDDGLNWRSVEHDARWGARYKAADASFAGFLWRVGGFVQEDGSRRLMNDVWRSTDGRRWERILVRSPWPARYSAHLVTYRDTLWLIGGEPNDGRMWLTVDGRTWSARTASALPRANPQGVLVYRDALWIVGHGEWGRATNDVWTSLDGTNWTQVTSNAAWPVRTGGGFAVLDNRLWVVAGIFRRDVWSSSDGQHWQLALDSLPGPPRAADYSVVFRNALWIYPGKTGGLGDTGYWDGVAYLKK
jgi:hypothetical protein